jgi:3',5'-cyclic AMP phosphodiesterase CpdA
MTGGLMTKICWITDPHFNFLRAFGATAAFAKDICKTYDPEALIITGDIAEGHNIEGLLVEFAEGVDDRPVYWLEGNHDYYKASISKMQERFRELQPTKVSGSSLRLFVRRGVQAALQRV